MSKIFGFNDRRNGSYIDSVSGDVGVNTNGEFAKTEKGLAWRSIGLSTEKIAITSKTYNIHTGTYSFEFWAKRDRVELTQEPILGYSVENTHNFLRLYNTQMYIETNVNGDNAIGSLIYSDFNWHHYIVSVNAGIVEMFQDGNTLSVVGIIENEIVLDQIGLAGNNAEYKGDIGRIQIYDHIFTPKERAKLYSEFLYAGPVTNAIKDNLVYPKPTDLSNVSGLVAAYNFITSPGGITVDIGGRNVNGTINGAVQSKSGLVLDGNDDNIDLESGQTLDEGTIIIRFNQKTLQANAMMLGASGASFLLLLNSTTVRIRMAATNDISFTIPSYTEENWSDIIITITNITDDHEVRCYFNGLESSSGMQLQGASTNFIYRYFGYAGFPGSNAPIEFAEARFLSKIYSEQEAIEYHNQFARQVNKKLELSDHGVGSTI